MDCLRCFSRVKPFHVKIILLDKQEILQEIHSATTGFDLLNNTFKYLNLIETAYFGLRYQDSNCQTHWLDPGKRVCRQIQNQTPVTLYLGVKFYAADPCRLMEEITRYQFFLQVKLDILQGRLTVSHELSVELAALALQSELGDYNEAHHIPGYVSEFRFVAAQSDEMEADMEYAHASLAGMGIQPYTAEMTYLEKVKWLDMYGVDLHPVIGEDNIEYFLGLTPSGIIVLRNRSKVGNYFWPRITKIYFKGKYFMLRVRDKNNEDNTYGFETPSRQSCKHLWRCCVEHDAFFRLLQVSPSFAGTGIFSLYSKIQYSEDPQKEASRFSEVKRQPSQFTRRPSKRYERRKTDKDVYRDSNTSVRLQQPASSSFMANNNSRLLTEMLMANGSLKRQHHLKHRSQSSACSQISTNSLPRHVGMTNSNRTKDCTGSLRGVANKMDVSPQSLQWLESKGLFGTYDNRSRNGDVSHEEHQAPADEHNWHEVWREGDGGRSNVLMHANSMAAPGHHQTRRAKSVTTLSDHLQSTMGQQQRRSSRKSVGAASDNESEASAVSWASNGYHRRRNESGSESERGPNRRTHRGRRKSRQGSYKLIESDEQWKQIQIQRQLRQRNNSRNRQFVIGDDQLLPSSTFHGARKSGYLNSGAETESEMISAASTKRTRRRRSRSRSPAAASRNVPDEVLRHLEFSLVEPNEQTLLGGIPFTNVETSASAATTRPISKLYSHQQHSHGVHQRKPQSMQSVVSDNVAISRRSPHIANGSPWSKDDSALNRAQLRSQELHSGFVRTPLENQANGQRQSVQMVPPVPAMEGMKINRHAHGSPASRPSSRSMHSPLAHPHIPVPSSSASSSSATSLHLNKNMVNNGKVHHASNYHNLVGLPLSGGSYSSPYQPNHHSTPASYTSQRKVQMANNKCLPPTVLTQQQNPISPDVYTQGQPSFRLSEKPHVDEMCTEL